MRVAAIDAGTNTLRVLIGDRYSGAIFLKKNFYLYLGAELFDGVISERGIAKLKAALSEVKAIFTQYGVRHTHAVATAFARKLKYSDPLIELFDAELGVQLAILDGNAEGAMVYAAVCRQFNCQNCAVVDIGGGSTEVITGGPHAPFVTSFNWGSLSLTERFFTANPPQQLMQSALQRYVHRELATCGSLPKSGTIFGVGGTMTALAFVISGKSQYSAETINGFVVDASHIDRMLCVLGTQPCDAIAKSWHLEQGRERVLLAGALIAREVMDACNVCEITASDTSLLEEAFTIARKNAVSG